MRRFRIKYGEACGYVWIVRPLDVDSNAYGWCGVPQLVNRNATEIANMPERATAQPVRAMLNCTCILIGVLARVGVFCGCGADSGVMPVRKTPNACSLFLYLVLCLSRLKLSTLIWIPLPQTPPLTTRPHSHSLSSPSPLLYPSQPSCLIPPSLIFASSSPLAPLGTVSAYATY